MRATLLLLALVGPGWWAISRPRRVSRMRVEQRLWRHVDTRLGARKLENDHRVRMRYSIRAAVLRSMRLGWVVNWFWPPVEYTGATAPPHPWRRHRYVIPKLPSKLPWQRYHRWEANPTTYHWTSEAPVQIAGENWLLQLEKEHAQAMGLKWRPGLFDRDVDESRDLVTLARGRPAHVPDQLAAEEELGA